MGSAGGTAGVVFADAALSVTDAVSASVSASDGASMASGLPSEPPQPGAVASVQLPPIVHSSLGNGIALNVVEHRALPVVHVQVLLRAAGASHDPAGKMGLANFTAELLREGAGALGSAEIAAQIDASGSRLSTVTEDDAVKITLDALPERLGAMLDLIGLLLTQPRFEPSELERLRRRELDRLQQESTEPSWLSQRPFYRAIYGEGHPYGRFDTTPAVIREITREDVVAFHRAHYVGGSISIVAVGAVDPREFALQASHALDRVPAGTAADPTFSPVPQRTGRQVFLVDRPGSQQSYVRVGQAGPARRDTIWPALAVSNQILGAAPSSRLFVDLRERRSLTYGVYSRVSSAAHEGIVSASGATRTQTTGEFVTALLAHLDRMATEPVGEQELSSARQVLINRFVTSVETAANITAKIAELRMFGLPDDWYEDYRSQLRSIDVTQVTATSQTFFATARAVIVVVGDARRVLPQLRSVSSSVRVLRAGE
jgi:predicted Zn-dependent peptidase